jgi:uncharacterized Zn-binding protein involved in type VI secretion
MAKLSRKGDANAVGGKIVRGASTVYANGVKVGLHKSDITKHPGGGPHNAAKTTEGSPSVYADGVAVLRVGSGTTCGHKIVQGSPNVNVP